jgi:uncharacterized protein (TIGR02271 family)
MSSSTLIVDDHDRRGTAPSPLSDEGDVPVRLAPDHVVKVPRRALTEDGAGYRYAGVFAEAPLVIASRRMPLAREEATVHRRTRETGRVHIRKHVREETHRIEEPVVEQDVEVERVAVGRVIDEPATPRQEGDTLIIPIMEERLVVRKEIVLKEELHVRHRRTTSTHTQEVTLRREEAEVERTSPEDAPGEASGAGASAARVSEAGPEA